MCPVIFGSRQEGRYIYIYIYIYIYDVLSHPPCACRHRSMCMLQARTSLHVIDDWCRCTVGGCSIQPTCMSVLSILLLWVGTYTTAGVKLQVPAACCTTLQLLYKHESVSRTELTACMRQARQLTSFVISCLCNCCRSIGYDLLLPVAMSCTCVNCFCDILRYNRNFLSAYYLTLKQPAIVL